MQRTSASTAPAQGKDYSRLNDDQLTDDYHYLIFPNVTLNVHADDLMLFRQRPHPTDPNQMFYDIWTYDLVPGRAGLAPSGREHKHFRHGDKSVGLVLDQDSQNLPGVQAGMNSTGFRGLGRPQELRIRHFHKVLDDYLYGPGGKPEGCAMSADREHQSAARLPADEDHPRVRGAAARRDRDRRRFPASRTCTAARKRSQSASASS